MLLTCLEPLPSLGRTGACTSLSGHCDPVALATVQSGDVTGGIRGGAGLCAVNVKGCRGGVVIEHATARRPGHYSCVGATVETSTESAVRTGTCQKKDR